jgi:hypothetical protein
MINRMEESIHVVIHPASHTSPLPGLPISTSKSNLHFLKNQARILRTILSKIIEVTGI